MIGNVAGQRRDWETTSVSRITWMLASVVAAFFALNYPWTHVALASFSSEMRRCPNDAIVAARARVEAFVGDVRAAPWIICQRRSAFGLTVSHGNARFAPLLPSFVVVGPFGINSDVIAHEWMHAEIAARTSALLRTYRLPTWFDEGLAMQLDHRADYDERALGAYRLAGLLKTNSFDRLASPAQFFAPGDQGKAHYALAKCVVGRWLSVSGRAAAMQLLEETSWRRSFPGTEFEPYAKACLAMSQ